MSRVQFKVNELQCSVGQEVSSTTTLLDYLRTTLELRGTKYMCLEGGCGACIVSATTSPGGVPIAVNSCLISVTSCHNWEITTIEKLGNRNDGYHPLMKTLAETNGTQCGYCSPGFVMSMYSNQKSKEKINMLDIERDLSSNICRCTGYRPILEAFKKFANDAPKPNDILDIEDLKLCSKSNKICYKVKHYNDWYLVSEEDLKINLHIILIDCKEWFKVYRVADIFNILQQKGYDSYMLVAGNTSKGVIPSIEYPQILIDITGVSELKGYIIDQNLIIGAGTTITEVIEIFKEISNTENFNYLKILNEHLQFVANLAVRNLGTLGGNLIVKHKNQPFASDIFLLFQIIGAQLTIKSRDLVRAITMEQFLNEDMKGNIIINVLLPPMCKMHKLVTYKVAAKSRNARAIINAVFNYKLNFENKVMTCKIAFGGLSPHFSRATITEKFLTDKILFTNHTLQKSLQVLSKELKITSNPPEPSVEYKKKLALGLFYKGLLSLCPENIVNPRFKSGVVKLHNSRPVSQASQSYETNSKLWPVNQPIPKVEGMYCRIGDYSQYRYKRSYEKKGVITFYSSKDIPGINSFTPPEDSNSITNEEILCSGEVLYYNQPIGLIVAETNKIANEAALLVKVQYSNVRSPKIDIRINESDTSKSFLYFSENATFKGNDVVKKINDNHITFGQYHFCLENMTSIAWPIENVLKIRPSSHYLDADQLMVGVNNEGQIQFINYDIYFDNGCIINELLIIFSIGNYFNCYNKKAWNFKCFNVITDTPSNTWFRSPATVEAIASCEYVMERISYELGLDPIQVRLNNLDTERYNDLLEMISSIKTNANYKERRVMVDKFNVENRWKKRGLRLVPMRWTLNVPFITNVTVSVFHGDGSVVITHGGVEIGQGINTKAIQVCAYCLNIPISKIQMIPSNIVDSPNNAPTAASKTSQNVTIGIQRACEELLKRLKPVKSQLKNPTWEQIITKAHQLGINLKGNGFVDFNDSTVEYNVYGVTIAEVEVDIITGEWEIIRVDLLEDVGQSLNPKLDIGQIEGAFIMSLGFWTSEELIYDHKTGELLSDRTWNYFVPQSTDIPQDFRVYLRKNSYSKKIIMGSKSSSEPPMCMGVVVPLAMREAVVSARSEKGIPSTQWFNIDGPYTVEKFCLSCETKVEDYTFY